MPGQSEVLLFQDLWSGKLGFFTSSKPFDKTKQLRASSKQHWANTTCKHTVSYSKFVCWLFSIRWLSSYNAVQGRKTCKIFSLFLLFNLTLYIKVALSPSFTANVEFPSENPLFHKLIKPYWPNHSQNIHCSPEQEYTQQKGNKRKRGRTASC